MADRRLLAARAREARSDDVASRVYEAIRVLVAEGARLSFYSVADRAQVARSTLYRNEELRLAVKEAQETSLKRRVSDGEGKAALLQQVRALQEELSRVRAQRDALAWRLWMQSGLAYCFLVLERDA